MHGAKGLVSCHLSQVSRLSHYPIGIHTDSCSAVVRKVTLSSVALSPSRRSQKLRTAETVDLALQSLPGMLVVSGKPTEEPLQEETIGRTKLLMFLLSAALLQSLLLVVGRLSPPYPVFGRRSPLTIWCVSLELNLVLLLNTHANGRITMMVHRASYCSCSNMSKWAQP
jgi:hypothetical protein